MFDVINKTHIVMHAGDTGRLTIRLSGYSYESTDRAIFCVRNHKKEKVIERELEIENNAVVIEFAHGDTKGLPPAEYKWDIRTYVDPTRDDHEKINGGTGVGTPRDSSYILTILEPVGDA